MNTNQPSFESSVMLSDAVHACENEIRMPVHEGFNPILIDLCQLFGARGLHFKVAVERYGYVEAYLFESRELLCLSVGELAEVGQEVRVGIRAIDAEGDAVVHDLIVRLVPAGMAALSAA